MPLVCRVNFMVCSFAHGPGSLPLSTSAGGIDVSQSGFMPLPSSREARSSPSPSPVRHLGDPGANRSRLGCRDLDLQV